MNLPHGRLGLQVWGTFLNGLLILFRDAREFFAEQFPMRRSITASDLAALTGQSLTSLDPEPPDRTWRSEAYSVVEVSAVSPALSERVTNLLMGASQTHSRVEAHPLRAQVIYDAPRAALKVILIGSLETTASFLKVIKALVEEQ